MSELHLHLIPTPGAKPEFLATVEPLADAETMQALCPSTTPSNNNDSNNKHAHSRIVLEGYTRDAWAWKPNPAVWKTLELVPTTNKAHVKLEGFVSYLQGRQKCAYARVKNGILVISYIQPSNNDKRVLCRFAVDASQIPNCTLATRGSHATTTSTGNSTTSKAAIPQQQQQSQQSTSRPLLPQQPKAKKKTGMLGNLLGAQERTQSHMNQAHVPKQRGSSTQTSSSRAALPSSTTSTKSSKTTAQETLQAFRREMNKKMLDFDLLGETENVLQVPVSLASMTQELDNDEKTKVTMDVLKYIVYEQAEEVNEEWVAVKQVGEFMDEVVICVYKEAPPEVLEEVNQVELPEEMRGQQRAIQEARQRAVAKQEAADEEKRLALFASAQDDDCMETLNVNKRDRRTIEEIQREMNDPKRTKLQESG